MKMFRLNLPTRSKQTVTRESPARADRELERVRDRSMVARGVQL
ncbi:hypothetical protein [Fodinicola feengrottensis]